VGVKVLSDKPKTTAEAPPSCGDLRAPFRVIVIYHHAADYPQFNYVARQWFIAAGKAWPSPYLFTSGETLEEVRAAVPDWMVRIPASAEDDPVIVETWI
jgi:hypothetical protein